MSEQATCRHCKATIEQVNECWRDRNFWTFCQIGDKRHEPEMVQPVALDWPVRDFDKTQEVVLRDADGRVR